MTLTIARSARRRPPDGRGGRASWRAPPGPRCPSRLSPSPRRPRTSPETTPESGSAADRPRPRVLERSRQVLNDPYGSGVDQTPESADRGHEPPVAAQRPRRSEDVLMGRRGFSDAAPIPPLPIGHPVRPVLAVTGHRCHERGRSMPKRAGRGSSSSSQRATASPSSGANLNPCPEKPAITAACGNSREAARMKWASGVLV